MLLSKYSNDTTWGFFCCLKGDGLSRAGINAATAALRLSEVLLRWHRRWGSLSTSGVVGSFAWYRVQTAHGDSTS